MGLGRHAEESNLQSNFVKSWMFWNVKKWGARAGLFVTFVAVLASSTAARESCFVNPRLSAIPP